MKQVLTIAEGEWQYWSRSYLVLAGAALFILLLITTSLITIARIDAEQHRREHQQREAEETFLEQPDRHPHRMVHYGHYVFRSPTPLAIFDPGLDTVTGQALFLEGHRQNSAMFAETGVSADLGGLSWLTPALVYQLFAPLLIVLLGHGTIVRERESRVLAPLLAQGVDGLTIILGKALAILCFVVLLLAPMFISCFLALKKGEALLTVFSLVSIYFIYLAVWALLSIIVSSVFKHRASALASLASLWFGITLVLPAIAVNIVSQTTPIAGKIETDLAMLSDMRKVGDGHNANDPAFAKMRMGVLKQYNVERIEDLPINFKGLVATEGERKLTEVLNQYANMRMDAEAQQAKKLAEFSWLAPSMAIAIASRTIAATDLKHYHRFLKEAEALRFEFVQGLNNAHASKVPYQADINKYKDEAAAKRTRVDAANWQVLDAFVFKPEKSPARITQASSAITVLAAWFILTFAGLLWSARSLKP